MSSAAPVEALSATRTTPRRTGMLLALLVLVVVGPFIKDYNAQTASRYAFTAALFDHHTVMLDGYEHVLGVDKAFRNGHLYSDKAPGQPFLAVPFYAIGKAVGVEPATVLRVEANLGVWWVTFWSAVVPAAILALLLYFHARRRFPDTAALATISMVFSTLILPLSSELHAHVLAVTFAFAAWHLLTAEVTASGQVEATWSRALLGGILMGAAIAVEYPLILVAAVIGVWLLVRAPFLRVVAYGLGALPALVFVLWYQATAFGSPFQTSYAQKFSNPGSAGLSPDRLPNPVFIFEIFFGIRGLLFTPVLLVALWYVFRLLRQRGALHDQMVVTLAIFVLFLLLQASWPNPWGGEMPGPRYLITAYPFLVVPLAAAWRERGLGALTLVGVGSMGLALVTFTLLGPGVGNVVGHIDNLRNQGLQPTIFTVWLGPLGWMLHLALAAWVLVLVLRAAFDERRELAPEHAP